MNRCSKTGLTDKDWRTILDVLNVYDANDIAHIYPKMGTPEFLQDVQSAFKAVLAQVDRINHGPTAGPNTAPVDTMSLEYQQWLHDS